MRGTIDVKIDHVGTSPAIAANGFGLALQPITLPHLAGLDGNETEQRVAVDQPTLLPRESLGLMTPKGIGQGTGKNAACIGGRFPRDHESGLAILHRIEAIEPRLDCLNRPPAQYWIRREVRCGRAIGEIATCIAD
ncbi:hypothetical protein CHU93_00145 [Sandarakinorhabdus cyanobacteriorum]|uniref:Uncharacterized protein n=1 Tax=Sandarakinorhabdus cyanobacteriorum TaxID=1981098 RepID=A0A255ZAX7_9SPHN|nr:hypothetical protein CHU93_00145 [Sandarakinorhabdus cyanobacteriorum]